MNELNRTTNLKYYLLLHLLRSSFSCPKGIGQWDPKEVFTVRKPLRLFLSFPFAYSYYSKLKMVTWIKTAMLLQTWEMKKELLFSQNWTTEKRSTEKSLVTARFTYSIGKPFPWKSIVSLGSLLRLFLTGDLDLQYTRVINIKESKLLLLQLPVVWRANPFPSYVCLKGGIFDCRLQLQ